MCSASQTLKPFKGESFHSLELDRHSNFPLRVLESPSSNSMIIQLNHSQWFFSQQMQKATLRFCSLYQAIHPAYQNTKYFDLQSQSMLSEGTVISSQDKHTFRSIHLNSATIKLLTLTTCKSFNWQCLSMGKSFHAMFLLQSSLQEKHEC